ncbi:MAG: calcium/sodium antiporter [Bacteroidales bacterium]|nr:calcium/sodium antiporter [Bacteroidales bacterium]
MVLSSLIVIAGLVLLVLAGNAIVDGGSNIARYMKVSEMLVGLTIVALGTSAPELVVNIMSSMDGHSELAMGNVLGSNNFNLFVVLGISGIVAPLIVVRKMVLRDIPMSFLFTILLLLFGNDFFVNGGTDSYIGRIDAAIFLVCLGIYMFILFGDAKKDKTNEEIAKPDMSLTRAVLYLIGGLIGLIVGGKFVEQGSVDIASALGVSEKVIGLTVVAAGTSLPELVTSIVACHKGNVGMAVGNIIGSNIMNILLILGVGCMISPMPFNPNFNTEIYVLLAGTAALFVFVSPRFFSPYKLDRVEASVLLSAFIAYTVWLILD